MPAGKSIHPMAKFFSTPFFAGPVLESYTSFTTQNHPMKRYNWSVWWEEACRMCDADRFSIGFRFHENTPLPQGIKSSQNQRHLFAQFVGSNFCILTRLGRSAFWPTIYPIRRRTTANVCTCLTGQPHVSILGRRVDKGDSCNFARLL